MPPTLHGTTNSPEIDAQVIGKKFPSNKFAELLARFPGVSCLVFCSTMLVVSVASLGTELDVKLGNSENVAEHHKSFKNYYKAESLVSEWREERARKSVDSAAPGYRMELIVAVKEEYLQRQHLQNGSELKNLFSERNMRYLQYLEKLVTEESNYQYLCWGSHIVEKGNTTEMKCSPPSSLTTYFFPGRSANEQGEAFPMDGQGDTYQIPLLSVISAIQGNIRSSWFSPNIAVNPHETVMIRTQFALRAKDGSEYRRLVRKFARFAVEQLKNRNRTNYQHIEVFFGGDEVQEAIVAGTINADLFKLPAVIVLLVAICWVHTRTLFVSFAIVLQLILVYTTAVAALSNWIFLGGKLPLLSATSFFVITAFGLAGCLYFYDTFVYTGVMATTGKRNFLTVPQRIAFTMRKASRTTTVANLLAICAFLTNIGFPIPSVRDFSLVMIVVCVVNIFLNWTFTPAFILFHHFYFSKRRRNLQRQKEIVMRDGRVFRARDPAMKEFLSHTGLTAKTDRTRRRRFSVGEHVASEVHQYIRGLEEKFSPERHAPPPADFNEQDFMGAEEVAKTFWSERIIKNSAIIHIPQSMCFRTTESVNMALTAYRGGATQLRVREREHCRLGNDGSSTKLQFEPLSAEQVAQLSSLNPEAAVAAPADGRGNSPQQAERLGVSRELSGSQREPFEEDFNCTSSDFGSNWERVARALEISTNGVPEEQQQHQLEEIPFVAHYVVASLCSTMTIFLFCPDENPASVEMRQNSSPAADRKERQEGETTWCQCWHDRARGPRRKWCWGRFGKRVDESRVEKDRRIMGKQIRQETFSLLDRVFIDIWAPMVHLVRWPVFGLAIVLSVIFVINASFLEVEWEPLQVVHDEDAITREFTSRRALIGDISSCDYCSAYYIEQTDLPRGSPLAMSVCNQQGYGLQLFARSDECGVCFGNNSCFDCAGVPFGNHTVSDEGDCVDLKSPSETNCRSVGEGCSWCEIYRNVSGYGPNCSVHCDDTTCSPSRGLCNPFTGGCDCYDDDVHGHFVGTTCSRCKDPYKPFPECKAECNPSLADSPCGCDASTLQCVSCPREMQLGDFCDVLDSTYCKHGFIWGDQCRCYAGFNDGGRCLGHMHCGFHGDLMHESVAPFTGCACHGMWAGPQCQFCRCLNGGRCSAEGKCVCPSGWAGARCSLCASGCYKHGVCPTPLAIEQYTLSSCVANFCDLTFVESGTACPQCTATDPCGLITDLAACNMREGCYMDGALCTSSAESTPQTGCVCKGAWTGPNCEVCDAPMVGLTCTADGDLLGCDGTIHPRDYPAHKVVDSCGVCGGNGNCVGCDGVVASGAVFDSCGICGGNGKCQSSNVKVKMMILPTTSPFASGSSVVLEGKLDALKDLCLLVDDNPLLASPPVCVMRDFATYYESLPNRTDDDQIGCFLFNYTQDHLALRDYVGFFSDDGGSDCRVSFILLELTLKALTTSSVTDLEAAYNEVEALTQSVASIVESPVIQSSSTWIALNTHKLVSSGTWFTVVVCCIVFPLATWLLTCSLSLTIAAFGTFTSVTFGVLSLYYWLSIDFTIVEQTAMGLVVGFCAQPIIHICEAYLDSVYSSESLLFAREITTLSALRGALSRTGGSLLSSAIGVGLISLLYLLSPVYVIFRMSAITFIIAELSTFFALTLLCGGVAAIGPQATYRDWPVMLAVLSVEALIVGLLLLILYITGGMRNPEGANPW